MKQFILLSGILLLTLTSCSNVHHKIVKTGETTVDDETFITYTVDDEYSVSVPEEMENKNDNPDRFSFMFLQAVVEGDCEEILEEGTYSLRSACIEYDTKEAYEERRTKDGNLEKYPFTLKGYSEFMIDQDRNDKGFSFISSQEIVINGMPAIINSYEADDGYGLFCKHFVSIQTPNGKLYRMLILHTPSNMTRDEQAWIAGIYNSFSLHNP